MPLFSKIAFACLAGSAQVVALKNHRVESLKSKGCSDLINRGTHFTIDVEVGTPVDGTSTQVFSVVADTGSNTLIVPSCQCQARGKCPTSDRCFVGSNRSSSFRVQMDAGGNPESMVLSFGSGQIQGVVIEDVATVGSVQTNMKDGILLMTDRALDIQGPFEGILGLGLPQSKETAVEPEMRSEGGSGAMPAGIEDIMKQIMGQMGGSGSGEPMPPGIEDVMKQIAGQIAAGAAGAGGQGPPVIDTMSRNSTQDGLRGAKKYKRSRPMPKGFLEQGENGQFSMCFNSGGNGVLRIGTTPSPQRHGSFGTEHWGVGLEGVSVGDADIRLGFCRPENLSEGQVTPCGGIPDSGTTLFMAPAQHIGLLLEGVCDNWDRCKTNHTKLVEATQMAGDVMTKQYGINPYSDAQVSKADVLQMLLMDCSAWLTEERGLDELPPIHFHVSGTNGTTQTLSIPSRSYIMEMTAQDARSTLGLLQGVGSQIPMNVGNGTRVCQPAFGTMEYPTSKNGPVWIMGTSLFYEYMVGYDMAASPPTISFTSQAEEPCGSCSAVTNLAAGARSQQARRSPLQIHGVPRVPTRRVTDIM